MLLRRCLIAAAVCAAVALPGRAADKPALADGKYLLYYTPAAATEQRIAVVEVKTTDGKTAGETLDGGPGPQKWSVTDLKVTGTAVTANLSIGPTKLKFEGTVDPKNPKQVLGNMGDDTRLFRAVMAPTELEKLEQKDMIATAKLPPEMTDLTKLRSEPLRLQAQARQETDADKRKEILDKVKEVRAKVDAEAPALLRKVVENNPGTFAGYTAALELFGLTKEAKLAPADVKKMAADALAFATLHGPRFEQSAIATLAETLAKQDGMGEVALGYAEKAVAAAEKAPAVKKVRAMKALAAAQQKSGKTEPAKATLAAVEKLEVEADTEYKKTMPPFKPEKFAGRKDKEANRVAVFEMFTGAQCPPCVAADLAFDALETAYSPKDLVLIQYHMHIPGPDPMTNKDTMARWDYYSKKFPQEIRGVPSSVFNGKPQAGGGGGIPNAKSKYDQYVKIIDSTLEQKTDLKVSGDAVLSNGTVTVNATVDGKAGDEAKVRVLLVEEEVRYQGGNGIRLHHQVVRSAFGKAAGWALKDAKGGKVSASVKLDDLKKELGEYLEDYNKNTRAFSPPDRPMDMKHLKVIVLVQDDETGEMLHAVQMDVTGGKS
jgi:hypothetical protein